MSFPLFVLISELVILAILFIYTFITGVPPMPTTPGMKEAILEMAPELMNTMGGNILELGSGWGTLAFPLAKKFPNSIVNAYELSPVPWLFSRIRLFLFPQPNLKIKRKNFYNISFKDASLIVCYLIPNSMEKLKLKFENELSPGSIVLSNSFLVPDWKPDRISRLDKFYDFEVYIYKMP